MRGPLKRWISELKENYETVSSSAQSLQEILQNYERTDEVRELVCSHQYSQQHRAGGLMMCFIVEAVSMICFPIYFVILSSNIVALLTSISLFLLLQAMLLPLFYYQIKAYDVMQSVFRKFRIRC